MARRPRFFVLFAIFVFSLFVGVAPAAPAAVLDELARDYAPLSGYVVMPADGEFVIDLGAAKGIAVGDLFSVVGPGEEIVHPVSGAVLGNLDRVKGFLQVTRVKEAYSHARALEVKEQFERGDVIRRFEHIPAAFVDRTGRGSALFDPIRKALPGLVWRETPMTADGAEPTSGGDAMLAFVLREDGIEVRGPDRALRFYRTGGEALPPAPSASNGPAAPGPGVQRNGAGPAEGIAKATSAEFAVVGTVPAGTLMADFARDGDRLLLAVTEGTRIEVFAVGQTLVPVAAGDTARAGRIYGLHWWQPRPGAPPLLAATLAVEENLPHSPAIGQTIVGAVFALREGRLAPIRENIPLILGSFDRDGDGVRETLLGQTFDRDTFFGDRIRELHPENGELAIGEPSIPVSRPFSVQGALFADLTGDGRMETVFVRNRTLVVYDGKKLLYESSRQMGGSASVLTYDINPGAADRLFTTAHFEVPPVAADIDGDGRMELVAVASEGSPVSGIGPGVRKSWLATLDYREGRFVRGSLGPELETPLQGLYSDRQGVYVVATRGPSMFESKKAGQLLYLPWNDRRGR